MNIKNKTVIITGASMGIGEATARLFSEKGASVVLAARSKKLLQKLEKEIPNSFSIPTDVTKPADRKNLINKTLKKFGRIDILVNNAGRGMNAMVENTNLDKYREIIDLNVIAPLALMQLVIPIMRRQKGGSIVNVSSLVSKGYYTGIAAYASTKYALNALALTGREELKSDNIIISLVHPYLTDTNFFKNLAAQPVDRRSGRASDEVDRGMPNADLPEKVAERILHAAQTGAAETMLK
jgi:short-subunit dehydrogenase